MGRWERFLPTSVSAAMAKFSWPSEADRERHAKKLPRGPITNLKTISFKIVGTAPYVESNFVRERFPS